MPASQSPLKPPPHDVNRIIRLREKLGKENLYVALAPFVLADKDKMPSARELAVTLQVAPTTAWKVQKSLPLQDISNLNRVEKRVALRSIVETPEKVITPSIHPSPKQWLNNIESELLVQLVDQRAHNKQAIGMCAIRQYAADLRAMRMNVPYVRLPSKSWYRHFVDTWLKEFRTLKPTPREYKRATAEHAPTIAAWFIELKKLYDEFKYPPHCIWAADESGLEGDAPSRSSVFVPKSLKVGMQIKGSFRDHVSVMHICNAIGVNLAPCFSFIGKWFNPALLDGAPEGSRTAMQENGYFEQSHMMGFLEHVFDSVVDFWSRTFDSLSQSNAIDSTDSTRLTQIVICL